MTDREKVMRAMEHCASEGLDPGMDTCNPEKCPYVYTEDCMEKLLRDVFALLKEQEPRVMTWEKVLEFIELPNEGFSEKTPCYVEVYEPDPDKIKWVDAETLHGWMRNCKMLEQRRLLYNRIGRHGWRLWTSRPSEQQMQDTKWEGDSDAEIH